MKKLMYSLGLLAISSLIAQADLIGQWNFAKTNLNDTVTGTAHRLILLTNGVESSTPVFSTATPFGSGLSLDLSGQSNCVYVLTSNDGSGSFEPTNMTYAAWVKINGWTATDDLWECVFSKQTGAGGFRMGRTSNFSYSGVDFLGAGALFARDSGTQVNIADGLWHLVAFTYDGINLTYYIDGVQKAQTATPYNTAPTSALVIGAWNVSGLRSINGLINDVQIYNTALSAAAIANLTNPPATVLFADNFNAANGTSITNPAGRAYGTIASQVYYGWTTDTNDVVVDGKLNWDANANKNAFNEQPASNGQQLFRFASSPNSGFFDWYPYVGGKVWDLEYDILTGNSHPLNVGLSDITRNGAWNGWDDINYDFAFGNVGTACRYDTDNEAGANQTAVASIFLTRSNVYNVRIRFNEPLGKATMYVNGTNIAETTTLDFESNLRYLSWGEPTLFAGYIDNLQVSLPANLVNVQRFAVIPTVNLISNGGFTQVASAVLGAGAVANNFNIIGTFGDYSAFWGSTAAVTGWSPYYADPYGLRTNIGTVHADDAGASVLDGTYYLDTLVDTNQHHITLNSAMEYRNGLMQTNILNGVTLNSAATYRFLVNPYQSNPTTEEFYATFTAALTVGSGANATNPATAVPGSLVSVWAHTLPSSGGTYLTNTISGADLIAAQSNGSVNVIFDQVNTNTIANYPAAPNPLDVSQVSQVRLSSVSLSVVSPSGDVNRDGVVDQSDVNLAQTYLDGNGGDSATNRQNTLINSVGYTPAQALTYLNLTSFDINGNNYFDASDVAALQAIVGPVTPPTLNYTLVAPDEIQFNWSGAYKLQWLTNDLSVGLQTNVSNGWVDYPNTNNPVTVTNNQTIPSAFFRLAQ